MADSIDTQLPGWLQRNIAPREAFDPTPWLQERYNRQITAQKLPLQLQGMALQNQAEQLAIEHQGMVNDIANQDLQAYARDLPKLKAIGEMTGGDPLKFVETPPPTLESVRGNKMYADMLSNAHQVGFVQRHQNFENAKYGLASMALKEGQQIPMTPDPVTGKPSFAIQDIEDAFNKGALKSLVGKAFLAQQKGSPAADNIARMDQAKSDLAAATASGDQSKIDAAKQHLQSVMSYAPGQQMTVFDKDGKPVVQMGHQDVGDLTKATQTEQQKHVISSEQTLGDLMRMRDQLNGDNVVGIWPTVKNTLFDKLMGNISPEFVSKERVKGRAAIDWSKQDLINQMKSRYGEAAVTRLSSVLPSTGLLENPENARILTDELVTTIAEDTARRSMELGKPPAEHVFRALGRLSNSQLDKEIGSGYLPANIALAAIKIRNLPPGQMPPGFEMEQKRGQPMSIAPSQSAPVDSGKITWDKLFQLYKSGQLNQSYPMQSSQEEE